MINSISVLMAAASLTIAPALGQEQSPAPEHLRIELSSFRITPSDIMLVRGHTYVLEFVNASGSSHDFTSRNFFASNFVAPMDRPKLERGEVELKARRSATVTVTVTKAGNYEFHCSHPLHSSFGMHGVIHVL